ncbi:MAG: diaminopimelate epimerase [Puniceicoccales bacterium]|nr:diaminopimelate epimerase [Puniceicoccales bacterium]
MKLVKYHALGNDYLFINSSEEDFPEPKFVRRICQRNFGIGADGVLYGGVSNGEFCVSIINPDASVAEISGNGVRIFARAMLDCGHVISGDEFSVNTGFCRVICKIISANEISVDIGVPLFFAKNLPAKPKFGHHINVNGRDYTYYAVSVGNPHCVIFTDQLVREHVFSDGPILESNPSFIEKTNVQFAHVVGESKIEIEIWERGVGYTLASGSSSCGVFAVARMLGQCGPTVDVCMRGGILCVEETQGKTIVQTGSVQRIAKCVL